MSTIKTTSIRGLSAGHRFALRASRALAANIRQSFVFTCSLVFRAATRHPPTAAPQLLICHVTKDEVDAHYAGRLDLPPNALLETALSIASVPSHATTLIYGIDQMFPDERAAVLWSLVNGGATCPSAVYSRHLIERQITKLRDQGIAVGTSLDKGLLEDLLAGGQFLQAAS